MGCNDILGLYESAGQLIELHFVSLLITQEFKVDLGLPLPEWAKEIYPQPLTDLAAEIYYISTNTTQMRKLLTGKYLTTNFPAV